MKKKFSLIKVSLQDAQNQRELYVPFHESDIDTSRQFKIGQLVIGSANPSEIRNYQFLKKYFALMKLAFHNLPERFSEEIKNVDELRKAITEQAGFRTEHVSLSGNKYWEISSISFDKMTPERFADLYDKSFDVVCEYVLSGVTRKDVEEQLLNFM